MAAGDGAQPSPDRLLGKMCGLYQHRAWLGIASQRAWARRRAARGKPTPRRPIRASSELCGASPVGSTLDLPTLEPIEGGASAAEASPRDEWELRARRMLDERAQIAMLKAQAEADKAEALEEVMEALQDAVGTWQGKANVLQGEVEGLRDALARQRRAAVWVTTHFPDYVGMD